MTAKTHSPGALLSSLFLLSLMCLGACGGPKNYLRQDAQGQTTWRLERCTDEIGGSAVSLVPSTRGWTVKQSDDDAAVQELVRIDRTNHRICLDAPPPRTKHPKVCAYGLMSDNEGDRDKTGYSVCNSAFTACSFDGADAFLPLLVFQAAVLTKACEPVVRTDRLWAAVQQADLLDDPPLPARQTSPSPDAKAPGTQLLAALDEEAKAAPRQVIAAPPPGYTGEWPQTPMTGDAPSPAPSAVATQTDAVPVGSEEERKRAEAELAPKLHVAQLGNFFSIVSLQNFFVGNLNRDTLEHISTTNDALLVRTRDALLRNGRMYCFAELGLVEHSPAGRNPRLPATSYLGVQKIEPGEDQSNEGIRRCRDLALDTATARMRRDSLGEQLADFESTRLQGKRIAGEKADPTMVHYYSRGLGTGSLASTIAQTIPLEFRKAFDYRKLQWVLEANVFRVGEQTVCRGEVGLAVRAPSDRHPRSPGSYWSSTWEMTKEESYERNAEDNCRQTVVTRAIQNALQASWDKDGLLDSLEWTREDGMPLVASVKRKITPARPEQTSPAAAPRPGRANEQTCQPPAGKTLRYNDRCSNGDCTRTFENGCTRRFQAPYCYDALRGEWGWKPDGC